MNTYDVVIVGAGAMGSAAAYQLSKDGATVLALDRYRPPHVYGSTHGDSRITRLAIGEGPEYVPLVMRSHELWRDIENQVGYGLLDSCGGLVMAARGGHTQHGVRDFLNKTKAAAERYGIAHESLAAAEIRRRFPQFNLEGSEDGYFEPSAGFVRPERCVLAQLELARKHGATLCFDEPVITYEVVGHAIEIKTTKATYTADKLVLTAGPWIHDLLPGRSADFKIYRQVLYWFDLRDKSQHDLYRNMPVYIWEFGGAEGESMYGFPMIDGPDGGCKVATEVYTTDVSPEAVEREVRPDEIDRMYERCVRDRLPGLSNVCVKAKSCLYTVTPDHRFVIDVHPAYDNVIVASPCSGHGFKHSAAIGEVLSQLVQTGTSTIDVSSFSLGRLSAR